MTFSFWIVWHFRVLFETWNVIPVCSKELKWLPFNDVDCTRMSEHTCNVMPDYPRSLKDCFAWLLQAKARRIQPLTAWPSLVLCGSFPCQTRTDLNPIWTRRREAALHSGVGLCICWPGQRGRWCRYLRSFFKLRFDICGRINALEASGMTFLAV